MDSSLNAFQIFQSASEKLSVAYDEGEAAANIRWLMEDLLGFTRVDVAMQKPYKGTEVALKKFLAFVERLSSGEPIQYVLGYAEFLGNRYQVNSAVLIPRPETEELVMRIIEENASAQSALDIGTGSGCIAISLAKAMKRVTVEAWDVERDTLNVAIRNARNLRVIVRFEQVNALEAWPNRKDKWSLIVSNPPYITEQEKSVMRTNVLSHEPHKALFVPDEDPLLFYREIGERARNQLATGGKLYFEINENYGLEVVELLQKLTYESVELMRDLQDKPRMVKATWPG